MSEELDYDILMCECECGLLSFKEIYVSGIKTFEYYFEVE